MCFTIFTKKHSIVKIYFLHIDIPCLLFDFGIETLIFPQLRSIGYKVPILLFMVVSLFLGVYLPAQYKLGYGKNKAVFCGAYYGFTIYICAVAKNIKQLHYKYFRQYKPCIFGDL